MGSILWGWESTWYPDLCLHGIYSSTPLQVDCQWLCCRGDVLTPFGFVHMQRMCLGVVVGTIFLATFPEYVELFLCLPAL